MPRDPDIVRVAHRASTLLLAVLLVGTLGGCRGSATASLDDRSNATLSARDRLIELARSEVLQGAAKRTNSPPPPGVEPEVLALRQSGSSRAFVSLEDALAAHSGRQPAPPPASPVLDLMQRAEAQRQYVRGLDAAIRGRHYLAVQELEEALSIDPVATAVLRQLARAYAALGNTMRAAELFTTLLQLDPESAEARFALGVNAANQRRFDDAVALLGPTRSNPDAASHDPAVAMLSDYTLSVAFRHLGYDLASAETAERAMAALEHAGGRTSYQSQAASLARQAGDVWRAAGDARCRLGEHEAALAAYRRAGAFPSVDPHAMLPRLIHVYLRLGWPRSAQLMLLEALISPAEGAEDRLVRLASHLYEHGGDVTVLREAVAEQRAAGTADETLAIRVSAALLPFEQGADLLRELVDRRPDDAEPYRQMISWLGARRPAEAARFAAMSAAAHPQFAAFYADGLYDAIGLPTSALEALHEAGAFAVEAKMRLRAGSSGPAYHVVRAGLDLDPSDPVLQLLFIDVCAELGDWKMLDEALAAAEESADGLYWLVRARAQRSIGRLTQALLAGQRAVEVDPSSAAAWSELALLQAQARETATEAEVSARRAIELDPRLDNAYETLLTLYGSAGHLPDAVKTRAAANELAAANPTGTLAALIAADVLVGQQRIEQAAERLQARLEDAPADERALYRLITIWLQASRGESALAWLNARLDSRPHDTALLTQWVRVSVQQNQSAAAEAALRNRLAAHGDDAVASVLLEVVLRADGRGEEAFDLALKRLEGRPASTRRTLDLAALHATHGRVDEATALIEPLLEAFDDMPREAASTVLSLAGQLPASDERTELTRLKVVRRFVERFSDAPMSVYGAGLVTLARLNTAGEVFDVFARQAIVRAGDARGGSSEAVAPVRDTAQALVEAGQVGHALRFVQVRMEGGPEPERAGAVLLCQVAQALAVAADRPEEALRAMDWLESRGGLASLATGSGARHPRAAALYHLSTLCTLLSRLSAATTMLEESLRLDPTDGMVMNNLGYRRVEDGHSDDITRGYVEAAHRQMPEDPNILDTLAWLRYKDGLFADDAVTGVEGAVTLLERAVSAQTAGGESVGPELLLHLGDARWRAGDHEKAIEAWRLGAAVFDDAAWRARTIESYSRYQLAGWGIVAVDPETMFDDLHSDLAAGLLARLRDAEHGGAPTLSPLFSEMQAPARAPSSGDE